MTAADLAYLRNLIPVGRERATSIAALAEVMDLDQRVVRDGIARLINEWRVGVVTLPCAGGVFRPASDEDYAAADAHLRSKAMSTLQRRRNLRLCREHDRWSPTLFDVEAAS